MCVSADKIECLGRKPDWYFERRECLLNSYTLDETLPFQKLYLLLAQNRDYNRSPTPVYDMAPFLHCACVRSAIFLASKTAASK